MDKERSGPSITPEDFRRLRQIFEFALERPLEDRKEFVVAACEGDAEMIRELERMFAAEHESDGLLDRAAGGRGLRPDFCPSCNRISAAGPAFLNVSCERAALTVFTQSPSSLSNRVFFCVPCQRKIFIKPA